METNRKKNAKNTAKRRAFGLPYSAPKEAIARPNIPMKIDVSQKAQRPQ